MAKPKKKKPHMLAYDDGRTRLLNLNEDDALELNTAFSHGKTHVKLSECAIKLVYVDFIQELEVIEPKKEKHDPAAPSMLITVDLREYPEEYHEQMREWLMNPEAYSMGGVDIG